MSAEHAYDPSLRPSADIGEYGVTFLGSEKECPTLDTAEEVEEAAEVDSMSPCQRCGRSLNAGPLVSTGHSPDKIPADRVGAVVVGGVDGRILAICRWCAAAGVTMPWLDEPLIAE